MPRPSSRTIVIAFLVVGGLALVSGGWLPRLADATAGGTTATAEGHHPLASDDDDEDNSGSGSGNSGSGSDNSGHGGGGDDGEDAVAVTGEIPPGSLVIRIIDDDAFTPANLTVDPGQAITFVNEHDDDHTATGSGFDTGVIPPGGTATVVIDEPGTFAFACRYHPEMVGRIGVRGPDGTVPPPVQAAPPPADAVPVQIANFAFGPGTITVPVGTTVVWTNADSAPHTVTAADGSFDSGILDPGGSFSFTFTAPGTYAYVCSLHPMQGTIVVTGSAIAAPPSAATVQDAPATPAATGDRGGPHPVRLQAGDCPEPGEILTELEPAIVAVDDSGVTDPAVIPIAVSESTIETPLDDLLGEAIALVVTAADDRVVACGKIGGPVVAGEVVIGLAETDGSGFDGVATVTEERTGVTIAVYVIAPVTAPASLDSTPAGDSATVTMANLAFDPTELEIAAGTTVTWTNQDDAPHTVTAKDGSFGSDRLDQGQTFAETFADPGSFAYQCDFHPEMQATITVT